MTDKDLPDKVRKLAARFRQQMEPHTPAAECAVWECAAEAVDALLPAAPRPTLADMTREERRECRWMQCDAGPYGRRGLIVGTVEWAVYVVDKETGVHSNYSPDLVVPRPDLPRMEWPGTEKPAPAPALPDGWRLADHKDNGRVIVTNPTPSSDGRVYYVLPSADSLGYDWLFCTPDELTYIDQEADTATTKDDGTPTAPDHLAVGTVIESADDPRIDALPVGSILLDRNEEATTKRPRPWGWTGLGNTPAEDEDGEPGPWTVLHIPKEADQ